MALVAWYKLDGNANDSSGNNLNGTAYNVAYTSGKIGQCGSFNGNNGGIEIQNMVLPGDKSISLWVKVDTIPSDYRILYTHATSKIGLGFFNGNSFILASGGISQRVGLLTGFVAGAWNHICVTYSLNNIPTLYINGSEGTYSGSNYWTASSDTFYIGGRENGSYFNGLIDDVRIYDHALSAKEVKELSQAKILHYKFDDFQEPTTNLHNNPELGSYKVGDTIIPSIWGGDTGTITIVDFKCPESSNNGLTVKIDDQTEGTGGIYCDLSNSITLVEGKTYTRSWWCYSNIEQNISGHICSCNRGSDNYYLVGNYIQVGPTWRKFSHTFTVGTGYSGTYCTRHINYNISQVYVTCIQVEEKDHATPFVNGSRTGTVLDTSGYDNHAELALTTTPRWIEPGRVGIGCYEFNKTNKISLNSSFLNNASEGTVLLWVKRKDWNESYDGIFVKSNNGSWIYNHIAISRNGNTDYINLTISDNTVSTTSNVLVGPILKDMWYQIAMTWNGTILKGYLNGNLQSSYLTNIVVPGNGTEFSIGKGPANTNRYFNGFIDDVRVYATALSAEDIKELYSSRASLDDHGNLTVYKAEVFKEEETKSGERVVFEDAWDYEVQSMLVEGNSEQEVTVQGKNLIDVDKHFYNCSIGMAEKEWGYSWEGNRKSIRIPCKPSTNYTLQKSGGDRMRICYHNQYFDPYQKTKLTGLIYNEETATEYAFTTPEDAIYLCVCMQINSDDLSDVQLEEGSTPTPYEPFIPDSPSPDYPSPVLSAGDCNLFCRGKNLFDITKVYGFNEDRVTLTDSGYIRVAGYNEYIRYNFKTKAGVTYTISATQVTGSARNVLRDEKTRETVFVLSSGIGKRTFVGTGNECRLSFDSASGSAVTNECKVAEIQIEEGTNVTNFEGFRAHAGASLPPLRKIGDVADTYNPLTGEYVQRVGVKEFDGTESFGVDGDFYYCTSLGDSYPNILSAKCSHCPVLVQMNKNPFKVFYLTNSGSRYYEFSKYIFSSVTELKNWLATELLASNPVTLYYELKEPIVTYLPPVTIPTFAPYTVIETDGVVQPTITATAFTYGG